MFPFILRSSHRRQKATFKYFTKPTGKQVHRSFLSNKNAGPWPDTLLKTRLRRWCFLKELQLTWSNSNFKGDSKIVRITNSSDYTSFH